MTATISHESSGDSGAALARLVIAPDDGEADGPTLVFEARAPTWDAADAAVLRKANNWSAALRRALNEI